MSNKKKRRSKKKEIMLPALEEIDDEEEYVEFISAEMIKKALEFDRKRKQNYIV